MSRVATHAIKGFLMENIMTVEAMYSCDCCIQIRRLSTLVIIALKLVKKPLMFHSQCESVCQISFSERSLRSNKK